MIVQKYLIILCEIISSFNALTSFLQDISHHSLNVM